MEQYNEQTSKQLTLNLTIRFEVKFSLSSTVESMPSEEQNEKKRKLNDDSANPTPKKQKPIPPECDKENIISYHEILLKIPNIFETQPLSSVETVSTLTDQSCENKIAVNATEDNQPLTGAYQVLVKVEQEIIINQQQPPHIVAIDASTQTQTPHVSSEKMFQLEIEKLRIRNRGLQESK
jgi:hypothetical protein